MARKSNARGFGKFLDFIGLVDPEKEEGYPQDAAARNRKREPDFDDDFFDDAPQQHRNDARRPQQQQQPYSAANRRYDASYGNGSRRGEYSAAGRNNSGYTSSRYSSARYESPSQGASRPSARPSYTNDRFADVGASSRVSRPSQEQQESFAAHAQENRAQTTSGVYSRHQTMIYHLHSINECKEVILSLIDKKSVLVNLEDLDNTQTQRALDTIGGATFAIGATMSNASKHTWLITPSTVEVNSGKADEEEMGGRYY